MLVIHLSAWILTFGGIFHVEYVSAQAQNTERQPLIIRHADQMVGYETDSGTVRELVGNVVMTHGDVEIRCDRARQEFATGKAELVGHVLITQRELFMRMERGVYYSAERRAYGIGNVVVRDSATTITAPRGEYDIERRYVVFRGGVQLRDSAVLITADSMAYYRHTGERRAWGNVGLTFFREQSMIVGDSAYQHPMLHHATVCGHALMMQWDTTGGDTLYICADCLRMNQNSAVRQLNASRDVRLLRGSILARADSVALVGEDTVYLFRQPIVWADSAQLRGNTISAELSNRRIQRIHARENASLGIVEDSTSIAPHQLMADSIVLMFDNDSLRQVVGIGAVHTLYLNRSDDGQPDGITRVASDRIVLLLDSGRIVRSSWYGRVHSEYVPEHLVRPEERYLRGFEWLNETKPRCNGLLHWSTTLINK